MVLFSLAILLTVTLTRQNREFNKMYADVIENIEGKYDSTFEIGQAPPMIPVTFKVYGAQGEQEYFYYVPALEFTPQWQNIKQLQIAIMFLLALSTPVIKNPKEFWDKIKKRAIEMNQNDE